MGIIADAAAIIFGGLCGGRLQKKTNAPNYITLAIAIMIVSVVGLLENVYNVSGESISSEHLPILLFSFLLGSMLGEKLRLEERLSNLSKSENGSLNAFVDSVLFFAVGGLQISGSILLALENDSTQLFIKSVVDLPFAIAYGAAYGKVVALSAFPVAGLQVIIALTACFFSSFFSYEMTSQLCAMGYIILFFSGYNLMADGKRKINNINMLPSILLIVLFNLITELTERI